MIPVELRRDIRTPEVTMGVLWILGRTFYTIECTWHPNVHGGRGGERFYSCIAPGTYRMIPHVRADGERCWAISNPSLDVYTYPADIPANRKASCQFGVHVRAGQYWHDVCPGIAPGKRRMKAGGEWMVEDTKAAMNELRLLLQGKFDIALTISEALP